VLADSRYKNALKHTEALAAHIREILTDDRTVTSAARKAQYVEALAEFDAQHDAIENNFASDPKQAEALLGALSLNSLARETPVETMYRIILNRNAHGKSKEILKDVSTISVVRDGTGAFVSVGSTSPRGAFIDAASPMHGVALSYS
jgi:hypothetical protein